MHLICCSLSFPSPSESNRHLLVEAGAISVFVQLLASSDYDVQFYSAAALSNFAVHGASPGVCASVYLTSLSVCLELYRKAIMTSEGGRALSSLIALMKSDQEKVRYL